MSQIAIKMNQTTAPLLTPSIPAEDTEMVNNIFEGIKAHIGFVPDALKLYSISPPLLQAFVGNIGYFTQGTNLPAVLTTMIRYLVSTKAECQFCIDLNEGFLSNLGVDLDDARRAKNDPQLAPLDDKEKVLLLLALNSINDPDGVDKDDIDQARQAGWSERDIFDAVAQAASNRSLNYILRTFNVRQQGVFS